MQSVVGWGHDPWLVCRKYIWHLGQDDGTVEHRELKIVISFLSPCLDGHIFSVELVFINNALLHTNSIHHLNLFPFTSSPHMCSSLCGCFCSLSLSPSRVFSVKENKKRGKKKRLGWKAEVIFCLSGSCLPPVQICCYFVPKGQNKSLQWEESPELLELAEL